MAKRIEERFEFTGGTVDRSGKYPVVRGVLLCGPTSANRRRYRDEATAGDRVKRYNNRPVFLNHGTGRESRQYQDKIASIENARHRQDGRPVGDLAVNPKHPYAEAFLFDAEHKPGSCGMSHVAHCETERGKDGWEDVTEVVEVESVDVVVDPATTKGLYESKGKGGRAVGKISLKEFGRRYGPKWGAKKWGVFERVCEAFGDTADAPVMDEPPADAPADGDLKTALMSAITPLLDEAFESGDSGKVCSAIKDFIKLHAKHTGTGGGGDPDDDEDKTVPESKKKGAAADLQTVMEECEAAGYVANVAEAIGMTTMTPERRAKHIESMKKKTVAAEKVTSTGRNPGSGTAGRQTTKTAESKPPADAKEFLSRVLE